MGLGWVWVVIVLKVKCPCATEQLENHEQPNDEVTE